MSDDFRSRFEAPYTPDAAPRSHATAPEPKRRRHTDPPPGTKIPTVWTSLAFMVLNGAHDSDARLDAAKTLAALVLEAGESGARLWAP